VAFIKRNLHIRRLAFLALVALFGTWGYGAFDFDRLAELMRQRWGAPGVQKFQSWRQLVEAPVRASDLEQLQRVNDFFNRHTVFTEDSAAWGQTDYWATPTETIGLGYGDCEDYAIAKLFTLRLLGIAPEKLKLIYVQARTGTAGAVNLSAHMVLAYYSRPDGEPLVLDNLIDEIRPASRRPDLAPVFSFNDEGVYKRSAGKAETRIGGPALLSRWEALLKRVRAEGFD
jgi:predicted transglutaminase-like cysteine proteinase